MSFFMMIKRMIRSKHYPLTLLCSAIYMMSFHLELKCKRDTIMSDSYLDFKKLILRFFEDQTLRQKR